MQEKAKDVVIDSDVYNECDDLWALSYLLASDEEINVKGIYIAPFMNYRVESTSESIDKSYEVCQKLLCLAGKEKYRDKVYKGAREFMTAAGCAVASEAVDHLIEEAKTHTAENPLYVIEIAAMMNIASALTIAPEIAEKIVVVWLGGNALHWPDQWEFNMRGDTMASNVLLKSDVRLVILPCMGVVSAFLSTEPELRFRIGGKNALCDWLIEETKLFRGQFNPDPFPWSVVFWDVTAVAYVLDKEKKFMLSKEEKRPILNEDWTFSYDGNKKIEYVFHIDRDVLMNDLFNKLSKYRDKE